jgi:hypothetical protein
MVGKRDHRIDAVAEFCSRLHGPAAEHGRAFGFQALQQVRPDGVGRGDDDMAKRGVAVELDGIRQSGHARLTAGAGHGGGGGGEPRGNPVFG